MAAWRTLGTLCVLLATARAGLAQTYALAETVRTGDCFQVTIEMSLSGELRIGRAGKVVPLKLEARAAHAFAERVLAAGPTGLAEKMARSYDRAGATITVERERSERSLRPERHLFVAQRHKDQYTGYSPAGPLTREEMELTAEHFDTLALAGLLPGKPVAVGQTWKVANEVAQALCNFEGLTEQTFECKLQGVDGAAARFTINGTATGIDLGALVKVSVEASALYDLTAKRLTRLEWKQKDERAQGPASPATAVESTTVLTRTPVATPASLSDVALVSVPDGFEPPQGLVQLEYHDPRGRFDMLYPREWQTVSQSDEHTVLRLLDRGDFIAQVTVTPWTKAEKGKHLSPEEFRQAMAETPGWELEQELQAGPVESEGGRYVFRLSALGQLDGEKVMQNFYLVAGPGGEQVVLAFTLTPKQADRLGNRDLAMAANLDFPSTKAAADKSK